MLEKLRTLLASHYKPYIVAALFAVTMLVAWRLAKEDPLPSIPVEVIQREAEAKAEIKYAKQHEEQVAKYEAAAKSREARESQLSSNIQKLKRELEDIRKNDGHVGGGDTSPGGSSGDATVDDPVVAKLEQIVAEQGSLIAEVTKERDELKVALVESKMATDGYKAAAEKRLQDVEILTATVNSATAEAKREIFKAEWRGGFKGFAAGVIARSLAR